MKRTDKVFNMVYKMVEIIFLVSMMFLVCNCCSCQNPEENSEKEVISTDLIASRYFEIYKEVSESDEETDNHDISAVLQTLSLDLIANPPDSWYAAQLREEGYMSVISTGYISSVYTVMACRNEISIADGFCDEVIGYYATIEPDYYYLAGRLLSSSSVKLIIFMNNYEYDKFKNSKDNR